MLTSRLTPLVLAPLMILAGCGEGSGTADMLNPSEGQGAGGSSDASTSSSDASVSSSAAAGGSSGTGGGPIGLHAVGNHIEDGTGQTIVLHGVNRSGTEYQCTKSGTSFFDGPSSEASVRAMTTWPINTVRIPLNESCWLGINGEPAFKTNSDYKKAITTYVSLLHSYRLIPILELHWVGPGDNPAIMQLPMPSDHSAEFWSDVATTFADDDGVVFEPYNEPYPDHNRDTVDAWTCWSDGCAIVPSPGSTQLAYDASGLVPLVKAIRAVDNGKHLVLLGGIQYSNTLTEWLTYAPVDSNLGAAWHIYSNNPCRDATCWEKAPAGVAAMVPIVATEIGESDCAGGFISPLMNWLDGGNLASLKTSGYLAWSWNAYGACAPSMPGVNGQPWSLVTDYASGTPNGGYAQAFHDHLTGL